MLVIHFSKRWRVHGIQEFRDVVIRCLSKNEQSGLTFKYQLEKSEGIRIWRELMQHGAWTFYGSQLDYPLLQLSLRYTHHHPAIFSKHHPKLCIPSNSVWPFYGGRLFLHRTVMPHEPTSQRAFLPCEPTTLGAYLPHPSSFAHHHHLRNSRDVSTVSVRHTRDARLARHPANMPTLHADSASGSRYRSRSISSLIQPNQQHDPEGSFILSINPTIKAVLP